MVQVTYIKFPRAVMPKDALEPIDLFVSMDASQHLAIVCVHARAEKKHGQVCVRLVAGKSKIIPIPRAELKAAVAGVTLADTVIKNLKGKVRKVTYVTDSSVVLSWISQDTRPMLLGIRSSVIEIRRFSEVEQWRHIPSAENIADLGSRMNASVKDID